MKQDTEQRNQGSGIFLVLIIATALGIGIYSTLNLVQGEFLRNKKAAVYHEAKQAAESLIQASMADLKDRFEAQTSFTTDALSPTNNPLYISDEFVDIYTADGDLSHLVIPETRKYTSTAQFNTEETEVIAGQVPPGEWVYIDPRVPGNEDDALAGTRVFERNIEIISKATVDRAQVGKSTVYARQYLQVRDAPLFAYAIFYNIPMEIAPGPPMDIYGNVHSNTDAWFQAGDRLDFHSKVTLAGDMYHGRHPDSGQSSSDGSVRFTDGSDNLVNMQKDSSWPTDSESASDFTGDWLTSDASDFVDISNQIWDYNVQTADHGILTQNPVGVSDYIEDTDDSTDAKESYNSAYNLIQPVLDSSQLEIPDESTDPDGYTAAVALNEIEQQKYAYKAGLTVSVESDGDIKYYTYERDSDGNLTYDASNQPQKISLTPPAAVVSYKPFIEDEDNNVISGMHDKRQAEDLNIIEIDIEKLKDLLHEETVETWGTETEQSPENWWNGIVYVDFPQQNSVSDRDDYVNPAIDGWGVKLVNGEVIPNPEFAHSDDIYGTSIATNQMMYVEGNYNADGDLDTGSPTEPDNEDTFADEGSEAPAALIADSITFLSNSWDDADSTSSSLSDRTASDTEVSAAILTGLVPSGETGSSSYSGGVENFPRFLETWAGGKTLQIRGSIVALFESEVGTRGWGYGNVYSAPNRAWGFHESFAEGFLPPGTPNTRRYSAIDFQLLSKSEYEDQIETIKSYF
jgi:hypothetical protein